MENFVVSARKYRPATFASVIGQEHITQTLKNAIRQNQVAHAFLFCGPRGVGKTTCARILAKTINCTNITADIEACNECESCRSFNNNGSFNIYELDAASNNSVDDIRALGDQIRYAPQGARYKIYIIDEVHMLSSQAFNAFLKNLEEPPPYAKFILATTERHKILPTILSRCQVFDFHRIKIEDGVKQLKKIIANEGIEAEEEALHEIARKADGAMRDALSIFDRIVSSTGKHITYKDVIANLNILDYDYYFKAMDFIQQKNLPGLLLLFDDILANGFDATHFLSGMSEHVRNLLVCRYPDTVKLLEVTPGIAAKFMKQAQASSSSLLLNALNLLNKCEMEYKASRNQRLHVELTLMKLCHIQSVIDLKTSLPSDTADDKKKSPEQPIASPAVSATVTEAPEVVDEIKAPSPPPVDVKPLPPLSRQPGTPNPQSKLEKLKQLVNEVKKENGTPTANVVAERTLPGEKLVFSPSTFQEAWEQYLEQLVMQGKKSLCSIYRSAQTVIENDHTIGIILASSHEQEMFEDDRINIVPYMRRRFSDPEFDFKITVNQAVQAKRIFTAEEKFKVMAEKNPLLNDLRNALGLELE